ncbi:putative periplasmic triheme cytochrome c [Desulfuromonas sp. DDH964]|nr:putative periplasmic triheme cytochrome c [Desulfuromonas sp. DDH964]
MRLIPTLLMAVMITFLAGACSQEPAPVKEPVKPSAQETQPTPATVQQPAQPAAQETQPAPATAGEKMTQQVETSLNKVEQEAVQGAKVVAKEADKVATESKAVVEETVTKAKQEVAAAATVVADSLTPPPAPAPKAPEVITYPASMGKVAFTHATHAARLDCSKCHTNDPPQKIAIDKTSAHTLCKGCHQVMGGNAPTACTGCHKKG